MFHLASRYLRRRLSAQTSGSARRRARERQQARITRAEGERIAREAKETRARFKRDEQREIREGLASYEPWGRAGGGAPNPSGIRYTDLRAGEIYPEDELRGITKFDLDCRRWVAPRRHRRRSKLRVAEDPQLGYTDSVRQTLGNEVRYPNLPEQKSYKEILDEMVDKRKKAEREYRKKDLEYEKMMQSMDTPWGRPGPGGTVWRNPRSIGMNFSKSMGWTDNETFKKIKGDSRNLKKSSLTLPKVKRGDDFSGQEIKPTSIKKLPNIHQTEKSKAEEKVLLRIKNDVNKHNKTSVDKKPRKAKFVKRLANGDKINREDPIDIERLEQEIDNTSTQVDLNNSGVSETKLTPEETILRTTGGIELVPLLARRRRFGARTLPSSDVTRAPEQDCQWRNAGNMDYLNELKRQVQVKTLQKEANRQESAEDVKQHHATWSSWWGRPGHGAPQRGRYARNNLALLLHAPPLPKIRA